MSVVVRRKVSQFDMGACRRRCFDVVGTFLSSRRLAPCRRRLWATAVNLLALFIYGRRVPRAASQCVCVCRMNRIQCQLTFLPTARVRIVKFRVRLRPRIMI